MSTERLIGVVPAEPAPECSSREAGTQCLFVGVEPKSNGSALR